MTDPRPRTVLTAVLGLAAAIALATGTAGPRRKPMASRPSPTPTAIATPAPPRPRRARIDRQDRPTQAQQRLQRQAQQRHRLLDQLPLRLAGARITTAGIRGARTLLRIAGPRERGTAALQQALAATGDDLDRYALDWTDGQAATGPPLATTGPVAVAVAYAQAAGTYGPASTSRQQRRARRLAVGPLRRPPTVAVGDDTQITLVTKATLAGVDSRHATVRLAVASRRRRAGALTRWASSYVTQLVRTRAGWRVQAFSIDPGQRP